MNKEITIKYCGWCGDPFEVKSPNQKYCPLNKKDCSKEAKRESWRRASNKYRAKYKYVLSIPQVYKLGSGWLSGTPKNDFNEEYLAIQRELKRLKIKGMFGGAFFCAQTTFQFSIKNILPRVSINFEEIWPILIVLLIFVVIFLVFGYYYE